MESLTPEKREQIKIDNPAVTDAELDEYQILLSSDHKDLKRFGELIQKFKPKQDLTHPVPLQGGNPVHHDEALKKLQNSGINDSKTPHPNFRDEI